MFAEVELLFYISLPFFICIPFLMLVYALINSLQRTSNDGGKGLKLFKLDADRGLAEQGYLWLSILVPVTYFFLLGSVAWRGYSPEFSAQGFAEFLRISTLPIALLSFSIPLTALVSRIHATHQTSKQIEITRHKNNLDSYYAHRKAIFDYFEKFETISYPGGIEGGFGIHPRLHLRFFVDKGPAKGTPEVNRAAFENALKMIAEIQDDIHHALLLGVETRSKVERYASACSKLYKLAGILSISSLYEGVKEGSVEYNLCWDGDGRVEDDLKFRAIGGTTDELIGFYRYVRSYLRVLCEFAGWSVEFFDEKKYPLIDKGKQYRMSPNYASRDFSYFLEAAHGASSINLGRRWENKRKSEQVQEV